MDLPSQILIKISRQMISGTQKFPPFLQHFCPQTIKSVVE